MALCGHGCLPGREGHFSEINSGECSFLAVKTPADVPLRKTAIGNIYNKYKE